MQINEAHFDPQWIKGPADDLDRPRSGGLHLSQIYADIESGFVTRKDMDKETLETFRCGGFLWERIFEQAFAASIRNGDIVRPGEWNVDGIAGSPDNIDITRWRVVETKATWKSVRKWDEMEKYFWVWLVQMKGYCRMVGTQEAIIHVLFINGDYKGSGPMIKSRELKFSQFEISENWNMIVNHARKRGWL